MLRRSPVLFLAALLFFVMAPRPSLAARCPNLVIVLDKSGSMAEAPDNSAPPPGGSKWELAGKAIQQLLMQYDGQLPIGLSMFASDSNCGPGRLIVAPDYSTSMMILSSIKAARPDSATPTSETINSLRGEKIVQDKARGQFFLLITDGGPNCSDSNPPAATVAALRAANMQDPSITTFVVGFGTLPAAAADAMDQMAVAGGHPAVGRDRKFYKADNLDDLNKAIGDILGVVFGETMTQCDDSCYSNGCPSGQACIRGQCAQNPCDAVSCGPGLYCFTDGVQPGRCISSCKKRCPNGTRCEMGSCIADKCPAACIAGFVCNPDTRRCEADPLCPTDRPIKDQCKKPSECQFGNCVDDPCQFIKCPTNSRCVTWDGTCEFDGVVAPPPDMGVAPGDPDTTTKRGCSASPGSAGAAANGAVFGGLLVLLLLLGRRRGWSR